MSNESNMNMTKVEILSGVVVSNDGDAALLAMSNGDRLEYSRVGGSREEFLAFLPVGLEREETVSNVGKLQPTGYKLRDEFVQREEAEEAQIALVNKLCEEIVQMEAKKAAKKAARQAKKAQAV